MSKEKPDASARKQYFTRIKEDFPELMEFNRQKFLKRLSMRYGENPGYPAAFYIEERALVRTWRPCKSSRREARG
jgi:AICAR transformylase/IMP cyclohydrolase PurH